MTIRFILKSGKDFVVKCQKFMLTKDKETGFPTRWDAEGISEGVPLWISFDEIAAIVRVFSDEQKEMLNDG